MLQGCELVILEAVAALPSPRWYQVAREADRHDGYTQAMLVRLSELGFLRRDHQKRYHVTDAGVDAMNKAVRDGQDQPVEPVAATEIDQMDLPF